MRRRRLKAPASHPVAYYHCVSRVVNRDFVLGGAEKDKLVEYMRTYERLYGLRVLAYCMMSNHFHILVEVPQRPPAADLPDDVALVAKVRSCLGDKVAGELEWELRHLRGIGAADGAEALRERWFARMWDISSFMKVLKQRFSQWFNGRHARRGTLWEDRYRSVLVEGAGHALRAMAAYIDLNPVRAQLCDDPKDYRWCGYAEAVAGGALARAAVNWLVAVDPSGGLRPDAAQLLSTSPAQAKEALRRWRCHLYGLPENEALLAEHAAMGDKAAVSRQRIPREKALEVLATGGKLSQADYLRCKVRYFSDGVVLGGRAFVEDIFLSCRERFGPKRRTGARPLRGLAGDPSDPSGARLYNLRQLRTGVFG
jgi:REP element-mobilizing transposase RayT